MTPSPVLFVPWRCITFLWLMPVFLFLQPVEATVTTYTNKAAWQSAAGSFTTIDFTGYPDGTIIADIYADLGIHFTDSIDQIYYNPNGFSDSWGLNGAFDDTTILFDKPMTAIAVDFPGHVSIKLYSQGALLYTSPEFGSSGPGNFAGLISEIPFDSVHFHDQGLFLDNLYFGPPIPGPSAVALLTVAAFGFCRRRRRA